MRKDMNVYFDGTGFVNNRGYSKYWGVSADYYHTGQWRVCFNKENKENVTYLFSPELRDSQEELTAKIAAHLYQFRFKELPTFVDVEVDGKFYRLDALEHQVYRLYGKPTNLVTLETSTSPVKTTKPEFDLQSSMDRLMLTDNDRAMINTVFDSLVNDQMSDRGKLVLQKMTNIFTQ